MQAIGLRRESGIAGDQQPQMRDGPQLRQQMRPRFCFPCPDDDDTAARQGAGSAQPIGVAVVGHQHQLASYRALQPRIETEQRVLLKQGA